MIHNTNVSMLPKLWELTEPVIEQAEAISPSFKEHFVGWYFELADDEMYEVSDPNHPLLAHAREAAARRFPDALVDVIDGTCGAEIYDSIAPTRPWLKERMAQMAEFADATALILRGWTYEPRGHPAGAPPQATLSPSDIESLRRTSGGEGRHAETH